MASIGIAVTAALAAAGGTLFISVASQVQRRHAGRGTAATSGYALGWVSLGVLLWSDALRFSVGLMPEPSAPLYLSLVWFKIAVTGAAIAGFGTYVLYAWTGRPSFWVAGLAGTVHAVFWFVTTNRSLPGELVVGRWATRMHFHETGAIPGGQMVGAMMFFAPLLVLAFGYVALWGHVRTRGQRVRLLTVAASLLLYLVAATVQGNPEVDPDAPTLALNMLAMVVGGALAKAAFAPPQAWRSRLGIDTYAG